MALTQSQEALRERLNEQLLKQHEASCKEAESKGLKHPPAPTLLTAEQIEYPKYLHKDWKKSEGKGGSGHHIAGKSRLVNNTAEEEEARKEGFLDAPKK